MPPLLNTATMLFYKSRALPVFTFCFLLLPVVHAIQKCGQDLCRDDQVCCAQGNDTKSVTCCKRFMDNTYYSIAMVTRKLSGVLIMLLLFAAGYFVQRMLCSRSRQLPPPHSGLPAATASQEPLVETGTPTGLVDPGPDSQLPSYEECKRLPTYEETVCEGSRGLPESNGTRTPVR